MLSKIQDAFSDPKQVAVAGVGILLLGFYALYARKEIFEENLHQQHKNKIEFTLNTLIKQPKNNRFKKIAITQTSLNKSNFTGEVLSQVKARLIANQVPTLVNCSPIKTLSAGCQCFLQSLSHFDFDAEDQKEYVSYYENAARCQLLVEKTIVDIESIKKSDETVVILCDNNTMDLKVRAVPSIWEKFLSWNKIEEKILMKNYEVVVHFDCIDVDNPEAQKENIRINQVWQSYDFYYRFSYDRKISYDENMKNACDFVLSLVNPLIPKLA